MSVVLYHYCHCNFANLGARAGKTNHHRYLIEVDCSSCQFKSAKLKNKEYTINAPTFFTTLQKKKDGCTKFLTFVGRWSAVGLCCC